MFRGLLSLVGPMLAKEMVEIARRRRFFLLRVAYASMLLACLAAIWSDLPPDRSLGPPEMAATAAVMFQATSVVQYIALALLLPLILAPVITEERQAGTLDLLLTTPLTAWEIILGKVGSRWGLIGLLYGSGVPVLCLTMLFGGVDPTMVLWVQAAILGEILVVGATAVYWSARCPTALAAFGATLATLSLVWGAVPVLVYVLMVFFTGVGGGLFWSDGVAPHAFFGNWMTLVLALDSGSNAFRSSYPVLAPIATLLVPMVYAGCMIHGAKKYLRRPTLAYSADTGVLESRSEAPSTRPDRSVVAGCLAILAFLGSVPFLLLFFPVLGGLVLVLFTPYAWYVLAPLWTLVLAVVAFRVTRAPELRRELLLDLLLTSDLTPREILLQAARRQIVPLEPWVILAAGLTCLSIPVKPWAAALTVLVALTLVPLTALIAAVATLPARRPGRALLACLLVPITLAVLMVAVMLLLGRQVPALYSAVFLVLGAGLYFLCSRPTPDQLVLSATGMLVFCAALLGWAESHTHHHFYDQAITHACQISPAVLYQGWSANDFSVTFLFNLDGARAILAYWLSLILGGGLIFRALLRRFDEIVDRVRASAPGQAGVRRPATPAGSKSSDDARSG